MMELMGSATNNDAPDHVRKRSLRNQTSTSIETKESFAIIQDLQCGKMSILMLAISSDVAWLDT